RRCPSRFQHAGSQVAAWCAPATRGAGSGLFEQVERGGDDELQAGARLAARRTGDSTAERDAEKLVVGSIVFLELKLAQHLPHRRRAHDRADMPAAEPGIAGLAGELPTALPLPVGADIAAIERLDMAQPGVHSEIIDSEPGEQAARAVLVEGI